MEKLTFLLLSHDNHLRTTINKVIKTGVYVYRDEKTAMKFISENQNKISVIIIDERYTQDNILMLPLFIPDHIKILCIFNRIKSIAKPFGNLICISKPITTGILKCCLNSFKVNLTEDNSSCSDYSSLVGVSKAINKIKEKLKKLGKCNLPIHIKGESGTGKTIVADLIHKQRHSDKIMQYVNSNELKSTVMESKLFGHTKGAFTSAISNCEGILLKADQSDLFLDEVGNLSLDAQESLLSVLDRKEFRVLGGKQIKSDFSLITASNEPLESLVNNGKMRLDFYNRISTIEIYIPPLKDRKEDIPILMEYILNEVGEKRRFNKEDYDFLVNSYIWPGNVRELRKVILNSHYLSSGNTLQLIE